jgi:regulator of protease activity HflC (stomatin/prohibitin superfamily)
MVIAVILIVLGVMAATALVLAGASVRVLREYERGIVFRLGRVIEQKGPGLVLLIPAVDRMVRVSLRTVTLRIPPQEVITRDNVPVRVAAVAYFRVIDPTRSVLEVEDFMGATLQIAQTTLRSVLGKAELDALLAERERLNEHLQQIIDEQTEPWGIKVTIVEIKDVEIPDRMQHALARQAEAERNRRAKVINAEGEYQAADRLADAADVIRPNPVTLQLRYLQALSDISSNQGSTIVFPMPIDLIRPMLEASDEGEGEARQKRRRAERAETPAPELGEGAGAAELREGASAAEIGEGAGAAELREAASAAEIGEGASAAEIGEGAGAAEVGGGPPDSELGDGAPGAEAPPPQPRV